VSTHPYVLADVFTDTPLEGNPLAVFTAGDAVPAELMQAIARETNLSETVFVLPPEAGGTARCRIFTPGAELPFAGHPVLGTAAILALDRGLDLVVLETGRGPVRVALRRDGGRLAHGRMEQPIPTWAPYDRTAELLVALGVAGSELPVEVYDNGPLHTYVTLGSEAEVAALAPDMGALAAHAQVNCFAGSGTRVKTRNFSPGVGVPEDPATGSAAGPLAVHLARHGRIPFGADVEIAQGAEIGRPSRLVASAHGSAAGIERVEVAGSAVLVASGAFTL
jgi:trans-2,3-dihydro-3-hydroxyanthranilate isomerase